MGLFGGISKQDRILFVSHLAIALKAGLTLDEAIQINIDQTDNKSFKEVLINLKTSVEKGETLANSLAKFPRIFSHVFVSIIDSGEKGGTLEKNLDHLAIQLQKEYDLQQKVQGAMIYPAIIFISTIGISFALSIFVLPRLVTLFESFGEDLPILTRIILGIAEFVKDYSVFIAIGLIAAVIISRFLIKLKSVKSFWDKLTLALPIFGHLLKSMHVARFTRTLGTLLDSGLSINESLEIVTKAQDNSVYKKILQEVKNSVNNGGTIYTVLDEHKAHIPIIASRMVGLGERTGNLDSTFLYLSDYFEKDLYSQSNSLATTLEPLLLIFVGAGVGIVAIAIIAPIYQLTGSLNRFK